MGFALKPRMPYQETSSVTRCMRTIEATRRPRSALMLLVIGLLLVNLAIGWTYAVAHPLAPALLDIREAGAGRTEVTWKTSLFRIPGTRLTPVLPAHCRQRDAPTGTEEGASVTLRWTVDCTPEGLVGHEVRVDGLGPAKVDALVRITLADGRLVQSVLRARAPSLTIPARPRLLDVVWDYFALGTEHILSGADHLLFVFGLLLLVQAARLLIATITAFTVGHSVTLTLAVLGVTNVSSRLTELVIALTVLALAMELSRDTPSPTLMRRFPWAMAFTFGLLHGLGFAGALRELGLPAGEIPAALLSFNAGIEAGQLGFVLVVLGMRWLLAGMLVRLPHWIRWVPVYTMGSLAAFWCLQRSAALLH